mmetsp:Transcript_5519/g.18984  ORF Transcript_5519/g.18984 Transcript_5519/m.18984 type:complete len:229 (+) Transcript_5519:95-781(+)
MSSVAAFRRGSSSLPSAAAPRIANPGLGKNRLSKREMGDVRSAASFFARRIFVSSFAHMPRSSLEDLKRAQPRIAPRSSPTMHFESSPRSPFGASFLCTRNSTISLRLPCMRSSVVKMKSISTGKWSVSSRSTDARGESWNRENSPTSHISGVSCWSSSARSSTSLELCVALRNLTKECGSRVETTSPSSTSASAILSSADSPFSVSTLGLVGDPLTMSASMVARSSS